MHSGSLERCRRASSAYLEVGSVVSSTFNKGMQLWDLWSTIFTSSLQSRHLGIIFGHILRCIFMSSNVISEGSPQSLGHLHTMFGHWNFQCSIKVLYDIGAWEQLRGQCNITYWSSLITTGCGSFSTNTWLHRGHQAVSICLAYQRSMQRWQNQWEHLLHSRGK